MTKGLITDQLRQVPHSPGVYLMRDAEWNILYVGKAADLQHRVRSYFGTGQKLTPKLRRLVSRVADLDFLVTASEPEAIILELTLIKRHHPHYNVRLKDDKTFPYLKISLNEDWPRVYVTRRMEDDGGRYFGPFADARSVRQTLKALKGIFPFRSCTRNITGADRRACLEYHINLCVAPCIGEVGKAEYAQVIKQVILFLEGEDEIVVRKLGEGMNKAAEALDFEKAAILRDQLQAIHRVIAGQRSAATVSGEQDVIAFAQDSDQACVQVFFIRGGKLIGRESFVLQGTRYEEPPQIMTNFVKQFYSSSPQVPPLLLLQHPVEDMSVIKEWLQGRWGRRVDIQVPGRGKKKQLVDTVAKNARLGLEQLKIRKLAAPRVVATALAEIANELNLSGAPNRMEGYDISNIQGKAAVGSMVVFENGRPKPAHYRRFKIGTVSGTDDYAMLREVLRRRFKRLRSDARVPDRWGTLPDLVLIDGGKGQLNVALSAMRETGAGSVSAASLAKEDEAVFIPNVSQPIVLPHSSPGLQLLQRLRDEAHRFALSYHHKVRRRETFASKLDVIPGIGPGRKRALLRHFGSVAVIKKTSVTDLAAAKGITENLARKIKEYL